MDKLSKKENMFQVLKFTLFSISAGIIQIGSYTLLHELLHLTGERAWQAYLPSLVLSVVWNFTLNRSLTFKSAANIPVAMLKVFGYYCVFTPLSTWWTKYLAGTMGYPDYLVEAGTMLVNFVTEFLFCRFVVYRGTINTNARAQREKK